MKYLRIVETRIAGIPCNIGVTSYNHVKGSFSYNAPSDLDYYGYVEMEYDVLDRRSNPAPWLEKKLTEKDREKIEENVVEAMRNA